MSALRGFLRLMLLLALCASPAAAQGARASFDAGVDAWRRGDYATARELWLTALDSPDGASELNRAAVMQDLGNASARTGRMLEAVGWYTAALRLEPRRADAWTNLEFARREAKLEPADRGDLRATLERAFGSLTAAEAGWLVLGLALCLFACMAWEALRGGAWPRRAAIACGCLALLALAPWALARERERPDAMLVVAEAAAQKSEPREAAATLATLPAASVVRRRDAIPGWIRVDGPADETGWVREDALFALER